MTATRRTRARRGSGDQLRAEIVAAAKELLATEGRADAVSIRRVADAVGVTSPSIYLHFADKTALLEAVVEDVFADLDRAMLAAGEGIDEPMTLMCRYGVAYVHFAVAHPEHYRLATMEPPAVVDKMGHLDEVLAAASFAHMLDAVQAGVDDGIFVSDDPVAIAMQLWASAHGIASLLITKPYLPWGDVTELAVRALGSSALGRAVMDRHGGTMTPEEGRAWIRATLE